MSRPRPKPLTGLDASFLYLEAAGTPMHVGSIMLLEPSKKRGYDFRKALITLLRSRMDRTPPLRRVLREVPLELGHPVWEMVAEPDFDWHVQQAALPSPGDDLQLCALTARLHAEMLPRDRPLWQFVVIEGLASGKIALYSKIHHALLDGQGGIALAKALLDLEPIIPRARKAADAPHMRASHARKRDLTGAVLRGGVGKLASLLRALPAVVRTARAELGEVGSWWERAKAAVSVAPRTPYNVQVGPKRTFAIASLPIAELKRVARGRGVSLNDVVMALCADVLRRQLKRRKLLPEEPLIAAMPVSLRAQGDGEAGNQVSMVQCTLATDIADPLERLAAIAAVTRDLKQNVAVFRHLIPTDFPGLGAPLWASGLSRLWAAGRIAERLPPLANLVISNVPGAPVPLYLAGLQLAHYYPVSIVTHGLALNVTVQSYAQHMEFGVISCKEAEPHPERLTRDLPAALAALAKGLPA